MENNEEQKAAETKVDYGNSRISMSFTNANGMGEGEKNKREMSKDKSPENGVEETELNKNNNERESVLNNPTNAREAPGEVREEVQKVKGCEPPEELHGDIPEKGSEVPDGGASAQMRY